MTDIPSGALNPRVAVNVESLREQLPELLRELAAQMNQTLMREYCTSLFQMLHATHRINVELPAERARGLLMGAFALKAMDLAVYDAFIEYVNDLEHLRVREMVA